MFGPVRDDARGAITMTRKGFLPISGLAALIAVGLSSPVLAQSSSASDRPNVSTTTTKTKQSNIPESQLRKVQVKVKDVDPSQHTVVFEARVSPEAQVTSGNQKIKIDQLKPGDEIRASFDPKTGEVIKLETVKAGSAQPKSSKPQ
jgi:hypothetical protein